MIITQLSQTRSALCFSAIAALGFSNLAGSASAGEPVYSPFTEESLARGIDYKTGQYAGYGQGAAFADLNGNGHPDLILVGAADGKVGIFENDGTGHFIDRSEDSGLPLMTFASGVACADFDGDGKIDIYFSNVAQPNVLAKNLGNFQFVDVAEEAGVADALGAGHGCAWGDFDGDGWVDLFVANRTNTAGATGRDKLFRNRGDGTFEDVSAQHGIGTTDAAGFQGIFFDYDRDGDLDLYISNDRSLCPQVGWMNRLHENVEGQFVDVTEGSGAGVCINSMGVAVGDFSGNGYPDLYVTNTPAGNPLLINQGDGTFVDMRDEAGVGFYSVGWGALFFDFNNNGFMDLYVNDMIANDKLYVNTDGQWPLTDMASELGINNPGQSFCIAAADVNGNGALDFIVTNQESGVEAPVRLFINNEGHKRNWLKIRPVNRGPNWQAIGTSVAVRIGDDMQYRDLHAGSNYKTQNEAVLHFGLDDADATDDIFVTWPDGSMRIVRSLTCNNRWSVYHDDLLGDYNGDGVVDLEDFVAFVQCYHADFAPGCEMMDFMGNGTVGDGDFEQFLHRYEGPLLDCNDNGILDLEEILADPTLDMTQDGMIDSCVTGNPADLNGDGAVDGGDLAVLLAQWGSDGSADLNDDGVVDGADLAILLANWTNG